MRSFLEKQEMLGRPGSLTCLFPAWLPGKRRPAGPIDKNSWLEITANGQRLEWKRDTLDVYAFHVEVPQGLSSLSMQYQYLTPTDRGQGRVVMTPNMLNLPWNAVVLYPAGHYASRLRSAASVKYPAGLPAARALAVGSHSGRASGRERVGLDG